MTQGELLVALRSTRACRLSLGRHTSPANAKANDAKQKSCNRVLCSAGTDPATAEVPPLLPVPSRSERVQAMRPTDLLPSTNWRITNATAIRCATGGLPLLAVSGRNAAYEQKMNENRRLHGPNDLVPTDRVRQHLRYLQGFAWATKLWRSTLAWPRPCCGSPLVWQKTNAPAQ